jgi:ABC-2 type transport system permease protein
MASIALQRRAGRMSLAHQFRVLSVTASTEFKLKYAGSVMGYAWSFAKPLAYFFVLILVFGHFLKTGQSIEHFALYLMIGVVLFVFFIDATSMMLPSIVMRGSVLRRVSLQPLLIPIAVSLTACITFCVNLAAVASFVLGSTVQPRLEWLAVLPLLLELYVFILGVGLILTTFYVRFRDVGQIWELISQLFIFITPTMFAVSALPFGVARAEFLNPFVQVMQDVRVSILGASSPHETASSVLAGYGGRAIPIAIALATFAVGLALFRRDSPRFAEMV